MTALSNAQFASIGGGTMTPSDDGEIVGEARLMLLAWTFIRLRQRATKLEASILQSEPYRLSTSNLECEYSEN